MNKLPAATTAHTAAALQSRVAIDIQTGRILKPKPNPHLGGDVSKPRGGDVSYLHDTPGHNMSSIAAARAARPTRGHMAALVLYGVSLGGSRCPGGIEAGDGTGGGGIRESARRLRESLREVERRG